MASACSEGIDTGFVALGYGKVAVLGVIQGITELMPISSTAHLRVVPALLGWQDPGSAFTAAMQLAALVAVIAYFWSDIRGIVFGSAAAVLRRDFSDRWFRLALWIALGTVPIVVAGLLLAPILNACGSPLRALAVIGWASLGMATLLGIAELAARHRRTMEQAGLSDFLVVGLSQVGALIPGVSRSGSTLTMALFLGFKREEAARMSFLLGIPAIAAAGIKELYVLFTRTSLDAHAWSVLGLGVLIGTLSAFFSIWALMRILERFSSWPFIIYRACFGATLLFLIWAGVLA